jgi:hypothetical protein
MTKVLITGSREWPPTIDSLGVIFAAIDKHCELSWTTPEVIIGMSPGGGVDAFAYAYCYGVGYPIIPVPAEPGEGRTKLWPRDFAARNQKMVDMKPDVVLAFITGKDDPTQSRGTKMTVGMAEKAGLYIERYYA